MAHWAEIDENNNVVRVLVGNNDDPNEGYDWIIENLGGTWLRTSFNTDGGIHTQGGIPVRKNFAMPGYKYDQTLDAFIAPQPYPSWIFNENSCKWYPPKPMPEDGEYYIWREDILDWYVPQIEDYIGQQE
jgi:hypothetical protein